MDIREMHYDFKQKLNKADSQKNRNLKVPEIDWQLNEAQELFVKMVANPRLRKEYGFEINQRSIDDIRTIVVDQVKGSGVVPTVFDPTSYIAVPPTDYWYGAKYRVFATKGNCTERELDTQVVQHDDRHERSAFNKSSFEWRVANIRFNKDGLRVFTDGSFSITEVCFEYLKQPPMMHNAADFGGYTTLTGTVLAGRVNCVLPIGVHREIVDLAVLMTAGNIGSENQQFKQAKVAMTKE